MTPLSAFSSRAARLCRGALGLLVGGGLAVTSDPLGAQQVRSDTMVSPAVARLFPRTPTGFVTDSAALLSPAMRASLERTLAALQHDVGAEIAVVTLPSLGTSDRTTVALSIGRAYKVGAAAPVGDARRHLGLVLLLVPRTAAHRGAIEIATGNGAEGFLLDATAGRLARQFAEPMRAGAYDVVARGLVDSLVARTRSAVPVAPAASSRVPSRAPDDDGSMRVLLLVVGVLGVMGLALFLLARAAAQTDPAPDRTPVGPRRAAHPRPSTSIHTVGLIQPPDAAPRRSDDEEEESRRSRSTSWSDTSSRSDDTGSSSPFTGDGGGISGGGGGIDI